jgi:hypothetical protein
MRPILVCLHPKAGMAFLNPEKSLGAGGGGKVFYTGGDPKSALYRIWFNAYLTNPNGCELAGEKAKNPATLAGVRGYGVTC